MSYPKVTAAVAGILAAAAGAPVFAATVTQAQAATGVAFYLGGSSAAVSGLGIGVGADLCGAGANLAEWVTDPSHEPVTDNPGLTGTPDFRAFSCTATSGVYSGQVITIYYRAEAGSVIGVYAPYNNVAVNELDLSKVTCIADTHNPQSDGSTQYDCATSVNASDFPGSTSSNQVVGNNQSVGQTDGFSGGVTKHKLDFGISDVEPGALGNNLSHWAGGGNDDPVTGGYYNFLGADHTPAQLQAMTHSLLFQQSFGFVANKGLGITDISSAAMSQILAGNLTDWSLVPQTSGANQGKPVTASATPIVVCHRDLGSGTRTSVDIVFDTTGCNPYGSVSGLTDLGSVADSYSTPDVLACVQGNTGSIGYVSIDNFSKAGVAPFGNVTALTLDGRTASNLLTAVGGWQYAVEASWNANATQDGTLDANHVSFYNHLLADLQALATAPQSAQVNVLPAIGGNSSNNGTVQKNGKVYVTSYVRDANGGSGAGNSCNPLSFH
jgi:hypothetical protein